MRLFGILVIASVLTMSAVPAFAGFDEGKAAYDSRNWPVAILNLRPLAEKDDARAQALLANMYMQGYGVSKDAVEAFNLYQSAARLGNLDAMISTATMYQKGVGTDIDTFKAIDWFGRSAKMGSQLGAFFYGVHMFQGAKNADSDIKPDHEEAYFWFRRAGLGQMTKIALQANVFADKLSDKLDATKKAELDQKVKDFKPVAFKDLPPPP